MSSIVCLTCVILFQGVPTNLQDLEPHRDFSETAFTMDRQRGIPTGNRTRAKGPGL